MFSTGETVGLAEWIIDDTRLVIMCVCLCTKYAKNCILTGLLAVPLDTWTQTDLVP